MDGRITSLDGLRAVAILLVFAAHAFFMTLGWVGVDLFFALSGFLITGILRRDRNQQDFWARFYTRRSTRILPPLVIALVIAAFAFSLSLKQIFLYTFFAGNIAETLHRGEGRTLGVLWSLAVEEHFYLVWPFAVRFLERRTLVRVACFLLLLEPVLRAALTPYFATFWPIYLLTPFRLDGLLFGSLLSILLENESNSPILKKWTGPVFLLTCALWAILSLSSRFDRASNSVIFNSLAYSLLAIGATSLLGFLLLHPLSRLSAVLSLRPLVFLGIVSYGFYLYHVIVIAAIRAWTTAYQIHHTRLLSSLSFLLSLGIATASFYLYELPIVRWGKQISSRSVRELSYVDQVDAA